MSRGLLVNSADDCVMESLDGLVLVNPGLSRVEGHTVLIRRDYKDEMKGHVAVVTGGGAGHEPAHAGYLGRGMLTAVVSGHVFASPPTSAVLETVLQVGRHDSAGVLLIVKNYTGDRLCFGLAAERARTAGVQVAMVVVADDTAFSASNRTAGQRGLAGTVLVHKMSGAMSEAGLSLDTMVTTLHKVLAPGVMGTIGLALTGCCMPGHTQPLFVVPTGQCELGLGIHGEPGVRREKLVCAKSVVHNMLTTMVEGELGLKLEEGCEVVLLVNNLGGTSVLEFNIICREAVLALEQNYKVVLRRVYAGTFMTSLDMAGVSLTVLVIKDPKWIEYLDAPTDAPAWPTPLVTKDVLASHQPRHTLPLTPAVMTSHDLETDARPCAPLSSEGAFTMRACLEVICRQLLDNEDRLNDLDRVAGDGDCGTTHRKAAEVIMALLHKGELHMDLPARLFHQLSVAMETNMGGTSGALWSLFLSATASHLYSLPVDCDVSAAHLRSALRLGTDRMAEIGGASRGDRTLLDALLPALDAWDDVGDDAGAVEVVKKMAQAAECGAENTIKMPANVGRASYVASERLVAAKSPDPGASAVSICLLAVCDALTAGGTC